MATCAPSGSGDSRSTSRPSTVATTAALARRDPPDWASSTAVLPAPRSRLDLRTNATDRPRHGAHVDAERTSMAHSWSTRRRDADRPDLRNPPTPGRLVLPLGRRRRGQPGRSLHESGILRLAAVGGLK